MDLDPDASADDFFEELLTAVDQQLDNPATRYVRKAHQRLLEAGLSDAEAREAIARCLAEQSDRMLRSGRPFDEAAYRSSLDRISPDG